MGMADPPTSESPLQKPPTALGLLEVMRDTIRLKHYSLRTEESYLHWARRFIHFHGRRHPRLMGAREITAFLNERDEQGWARCA